MCSHCPPAATGRRVSTRAGSRLLVMDCPSCDGMPLRAAFSSVVRCGYPSCGACGSAYVFRCPGEHVAYCEARDLAGLPGDVETRHPVLADVERRECERAAREARRGHGVDARWRCHCCAGFVSGEHASCSQCRTTGTASTPHYCGEDGGRLGNAHRKRQRSRAAVSRAVSRVVAPAPAVEVDLPF